MSKNKNVKVKKISTFPEVKHDYTQNPAIKLGTKDLLDPSYVKAANKAMDLEIKQRLAKLKNPEVAKFVTLLQKLRSDSSLWKAGGAGGQDQYAGLPPAMRLIDEALEGYE